MKDERPEVNRRGKLRTGKRRVVASCCRVSTDSLLCTSTVVPRARLDLVRAITFVARGTRRARTVR